MTRGIHARKGKGKSSLGSVDSQNRGHTMGQTYFIKESRPVELGSSEQEERSAG